MPSPRNRREHDNQRLSTCTAYPKYTALKRPEINTHYFIRQLWLDHFLLTHLTNKISALNEYVLDVTKDDISRIFFKYGE
jgi:hypothetical protein